MVAYILKLTVPLDITWKKRPLVRGLPSLLCCKSVWYRPAKDLHRRSKAVHVFPHYSHRKRFDHVSMILLNRKIYTIWPSAAHLPKIGRNFRTPFGIAEKMRIAPEAHFSIFFVSPSFWVTIRLAFLFSFSLLVNSSTISADCCLCQVLVIKYDKI